MTLAAFLASLVILVGIGLWSARRASGTAQDYYLASRAVSPMFVGLSAIATNNSGYMFIGVIGYTYSTGLPAFWLMFGWIMGDFIASTFIHRRLCAATEATREPTFAGVLSRWNGTDFRRYRKIAAIITVVFLGAYAAAQFSAGGKALQALFGWNPKSGAVIAAIIVTMYCFAGGIRASIWTDVAQSLMMVVAMGILFVAAINGQGGLAEAWNRMDQIPGYLNWFPSDVLVPGLAGVAMFVIGWMFAGFSVVGQPHVMIRFMALEDAGKMGQARAWYYGFFTIFYVLATGVGLLTRLYIPELQGMDPELALPRISQELLSPFLVGVILAGIFAATMSTADSLILSCSASVTHDLLPKKTESPLHCKIATLLVTVLALGLALSGSQSVFSLVILAWGVLASAFAPLLLVYSVGGRPNEAVALTMSVVGVAVALGWRELGWHAYVYEGMPGILSGFLVYGLARPFLARAPGRSPAE